jgi:hypothetical protein
MPEIKVGEMFEKQVEKAAVIKSERKSAQSRDMRSSANAISLWFFTLCALPVVAALFNQISLKQSEYFCFLVVQLQYSYTHCNEVCKSARGWGSRAIHTWVSL